MLKEAYAAIKKAWSSPIRRLRNVNNLFLITLEATSETHMHSLSLPLSFPIRTPQKLSQAAFSPWTQEIWLTVMKHFLFHGVD